MSASKAHVEKLLGNKNKFQELKQRILFVLGALIVFRLGTYIPVPGVNPAALAAMLDQQSGTLIGMFNMFSGGALGRFSIFALGVKITQLTRYFTVVLAAFQAFGIATFLQNTGAINGIPVVTNPGFGFLFTAVVTLTGGTLFLMWLGEQITERGIGNGISLLIFAGIVAGLPAAVVSVFTMVSQGQLNIQYARRGGRMGLQSQTSYLPLKINMAGVIPVIFASSLVMFPATIAQFLGQKPGWGWLQDVAAALSPGQPFYVLLFGGLIVFFTFFYTALTFDPYETAENLKRSGAVIPGIRPGKQTAEFLDKILTRLTFWGALYLLGVSLMPEWVTNYFNVPFALGGTSLLIVVLMSQQYDSLFKKTNLKNYGKSGVVRR